MVLSASAHPSPWVVARQLGLETHVLTRRWSEHARAHGYAIGKALRAEAFQARDGHEQLGGTAANSQYQVIPVPPVPAESQLIEAYDITQGKSPFDGINVKMAWKLRDATARLISEELDANKVSVTVAKENLGRGLEVLEGKAEGRTICPATALYFDDRTLLEAFLAAPWTRDLPRPHRQNS